MKKTSISEMTVLFADVAGSVQLYDAIGDFQAHQQVVECLNHMTAAVKKFKGRVVEIIGDELMSVFLDPDSAFDAAYQIQKNLAKESKSQLGVRIGFHFGQVAQTKDGHPYGDTVNVAARMVSMAKSGQIITNNQTRKRLATPNKIRMRYVDRVFIKGKKTPYDLHEVVWDERESTILLGVQNDNYTDRRSAALSLYLTHAGKQIHLTEASGELTLGRGPRCGLIVGSDAASRLHGTVSCQNGKIVYKDQSTNGTYIRTLEGKRFADGQDMVVHNEQWVFGGRGMLSLGEPLINDDSNWIHFRIE